jgi:hypothetical protein
VATSPNYSPTAPAPESIAHVVQTYVQAARDHQTRNPQANQHIAGTARQYLDVASDPNPARLNAMRTSQPELVHALESMDYSVLDQASKLDQVV